ncbi:MAG: biotin/lipoyl-containing protein [Verrucomicrobiota bacterium]
MGEFRMPSLGSEMESGKLLVWRVQPNDHVKRGDIMAEIETDKSAIEIETFEDGIVDRLLVEPGATVPVGTVLATIRPERAPSD